MDTNKFLRDFVDSVVPNLDTTEQSIYLYTVRHSLIEGKDNVLVSISNAAKSNAFGLGNRGGTMGRYSTHKKVYSLEQKGFIKVVDSTHSGLRIKPILPWDNPNIKKKIELKEVEMPLEELDFYSDPTLRRSILKRENNRCFYSFRKITDENFVLDHMVSRPKGNNTYKNLVASTKSIHDKKGNASAEDFIRSLYRDGLLSEDELKDRLQALEQLKAGELKPKING